MRLRKQRKVKVSKKKPKRPEVSEEAYSYRERQEKRWEESILDESKELKWRMECLRIMANGAETYRPEAAMILVRAFDSKEARIREFAADRLFRFHHPPAMDIVIEGAIKKFKSIMKPPAEKNSARDRFAVLLLKGLAELKAKEAEPLFLRHVNDPVLAREALHGLKEINSPRAEKAALRLMGRIVREEWTSTHEDFLYAAEALGGVAFKKAEKDPKLLTLFEDIMQFRASPGLRRLSLAASHNPATNLLFYAVATQPLLRAQLPSSPEEKGAKRQFLRSLRADVKNRPLEEIVRILGLYEKKKKKKK